MQAQNVEVGGRRVRYYQGGGQSRPTIVLLHGWSMDGAAYCRLGELLAQDFQVLIPDLPGYGKSKRPERDDINTLAHSLAAFFRKLGLRRVTLVGHSLGGAVALRFSQMYPDRVAHLILIDSTGVPTDRSLLGWGLAAAKKVVHSLRHPRGLYQVTRAFSWNVFCHPYWMVRTFRTTIHCDLTGYPKPSVPVTVFWADRDEYYPMGDPLAFACGVFVHVVHANHDWPIIKPHLAAAKIKDYS